MTTLATCLSTTIAFVVQTFRFVSFTIKQNVLLLKTFHVFSSPLILPSFLFLKLVYSNLVTLGANTDDVSVCCRNVWKVAFKLLTYYSCVFTCRVTHVFKICTQKNRGFVVFGTPYRSCVWKTRLKIVDCSCMFQRQTNTGVMFCPTSASRLTENGLSSGIDAIMDHGKISSLIVSNLVFSLLSWASLCH